MDDIELVIGKLSRENPFTEFTWYGDPLKFVHDETIILVDGFGFTDGHTGEIFYTGLCVFNVLQMILDRKRKYETMVTLREFTSKYIILRIWEE
jgi:hypothetical protein